LVRDRIRITLEQGTVQFATPQNGLVWAAAFDGRGRVQVEPPHPLEAQQIRLFLGKDAVDLEFSEAVFHFGDGTFEEFARQVQWGAPAGTKLGRLMSGRQQEREEMGEELLPRVLKSVLSADRKRVAFFTADLKTREKDWVQVTWDLLDPEEVRVGRWTQWGSGVGRFETWLSFPAADRVWWDAWKDPLAREDLAMEGYRIDTTVTGGAELRAMSRVAGKARAAGERVLLFELDANLRVESVKDGEKALAFFQARDPKGQEKSYGDYVAVVLPAPSKAAQDLALEFRYAGKHVIRKAGSGNFFCQSYGWYPTRPNSFAGRVNFELLFRSPKQHTLVATGRKVKETQDGNTVTTEWKSDLPLAVAGFAFGDFKLQTEKAGDVTVEVYANRRPDDTLAAVNLDEGFGPTAGRAPLGSLSPAALAKTMGIEVANTIRVFEGYFGPYPYKTLAVTNIPYSYGQGWPGLLYLSALSFLDSTQRQNLGITQHTELTDFFRAHEASHQWWGHRVGWKSYHDQWLSEGFAQFSGNLYVLFRQGEKEFVNRLRLDKEELVRGRDQKNRTYESLGPVWMGLRLATADSPRAYSTVVYNKGGLVLNALRSMLLDPQTKPMDARFIAMMKEFCQTYHNQPASTEDFKAIAEKHMLPVMDLEGNGRLDWFFGQYVYRTGVPKYEFKYAVEPAGEGKWKVSGKITPRTVPPGWVDILRLYIQAGGRTGRLGWLRATHQETPFEFTLPMKPEKLSLNNNEDTIADIQQ